MAIFAVVFDNQVRELREYDAQPECKLVDGVPTVRPFFDAPETLEDKHDGFVIHADRVERKLAKRTLQEAKDYVKAQAKIAKAKYFKTAKEKQVDKDIENAADVADLAAIDLTTGW